MKVEYKRNKRSRNIRITVKSANEVLVTYPWWSNRKTAEKFVEEKKEWIEKTQERRERKGDLLTGGSRADFLKNKEKARRLVYLKIRQFNAHYGFRYKRVSIRNQKTRWGSCSGDGNLNFSYRIVYLPEELVDYLIVHELCHLKELNHSRDFWQLVSQTVSDYKKLSKKLKKL